jgi:hypothetical protein
MKLSCTCKDFENNYGLLDAQIQLLQNMGFSIFPLEFNYCPWCGKELVKEGKEVVGLFSIKKKKARGAGIDPIRKLPFFK